MYRKYYNYKKRNSFNKEVKGISTAIMGGLLLVFAFYNTYIKPNLDTILFYSKIIIPILVLLAGGYIFLKLQSKKKAEKERLEKIPIFLQELEQKIQSFKPLRDYDQEILYHTELAGFLKNSYPNLDIEVAKDYSRPDIVIDNIAIEIKGPTDMGGLKSLPDKINAYLPKWDYLFIVLFNVRIVSYDKEKNEDAYNKKIEEIMNNVIEAKKEKIFIIRID